MVDGDQTEREEAPINEGVGQAGERALLDHLALQHHLPHEPADARTLAVRDRNPGVGRDAPMMDATLRKRHQKRPIEVTNTKMRSAVPPRMHRS